MKRTFIKAVLLLIVFTLLLSFASCKNKKGEEITTPELVVPTPKQIWLLNTEIDYEAGYKSVYSYDEYGNEVKEVRETFDGTPVGTVVKEYDEQNRFVNGSYTNRSGMVEYTQSYRYDDNGNPIEWIYITKNMGDQLVYTYEYDAKGRLLTEILNGSVSKQYTYIELDDGGYQKRQNENRFWRYDKDGKLVFASLSVTVKVEYTYNDVGNLMKEVRSERGELTYTITYEYDENGNNTSVKKTTADGEETLVYEYTYQLYTVNER